MSNGSRFVTKASLVIAALLLAPALTHAGGVIGGGGGGGTMKPEPTNKEFVEYAIENTKGLILAWLNNLESRNVGCGNVYSQLDYKLSSNTKLMQKLFGGPKDIFRVVNDLKIEIHGSGPCLDSEDANHDASIHSGTPGAICLSSARLAKKLNNANYQPQVAALILHEITHLMSGDEAEARLVQRVALNDLGLVSITEFFSIASNVAGDLADMSDNASWALKESNDAPEFHRIVDYQIRLNNHLNSDLLSFNPVLTPFRLLDGVTIEDKYESRLEAVRTYACANDPSEYAMIRADCQKEYDNGFAGQTSIDVSDYITNAQPYPPPPPGYQCHPPSVKLMMRKIQSPADLQAELSEIHDFFKTAASNAAEFGMLGNGFAVVKK